MIFLRALLVFLGGLLLGIFSIGIISALPFPYSEFPLFPILIALALVLRSRTSVFWYLLIAIALTDLYRGAGFGVGVLGLVVLTMIGHRISSELVTHRSIVGCFVIAAVVGALWTLTVSVLTAMQSWWQLGNSGLDGISLLVSVAIQAGTTAVVCSLVYSLLPRWWHARSPMAINTRGL